jgi:hypothetical protein
MAATSRFVWCILALILLGGLPMIGMPGSSYRGTLPEMTGEERDLQARLEGHVRVLAGEIGERNMFRYDSLRKAAAYISCRFREMGYSVRELRYSAAGKEAANLEVEVKGGGNGEEIVVVGAHYDSVAGSPGGDDNASGVAAMLELARRFRGKQPARTLRFLAFVNEEPPFFLTEEMGSLVYAREAKRRGEKIAAMYSLETIGCYSDASGSQLYPLPLNPFFPDTGNFIGFVGNLASGRLVRRSIETFRQTTRFPSEGVAAPEAIIGIGWSDQWSFWQVGYPAIMITDTAPFRYRHYHTATDTPEKLDYARMARVTAGLARVIEREANR